MLAKWLVGLASLAAAAAMTLHTASAAEIKVLASNGVKAALEELMPAFERETGNKVTVEFGLAAVLKRQIESGAAFDVAILTSAGIDDLAKQGKVDGSARAAVARSGVGIGVRAGAPRPDIGTADALKRTLLAAKSVSWAKEGASGTYFVTVLQRLGIADQVKPKEVLGASGTEVGDLLVSGKAELGVLLVNELMAHKGVDVVGPLPADLQSYTVFHAGAAAASKSANAAKALMRYITSPAAGAVFKSKGQEPG